MRIARTAPAILVALLGAAAPSAVAQTPSGESSSAPTHPTLAVAGAADVKYSTTHASTVSSLRSAATATFRTNGKVGLQGTWMTTVSIANPPPGIGPRFFALDTFVPGGALVVSSSAAMPSLRTLAHGQWIRTGNRRFASTFVWFRFDPAGAFVGMQRVRRTIDLAPGLDAFHSTDVIEVTDPTGTVLTTLHASEDGKRLGAG
jgi:hypothetical protein